MASRSLARALHERLDQESRVEFTGVPDALSHATTVAEARVFLSSPYVLSLAHIHPGERKAALSATSPGRPGAPAVREAVVAPSARLVRVQLHLTFNRSYHTPSLQPLRHRSCTLINPTNFDVYAAINALHFQEKGRRKGYVPVALYHTRDGRCSTHAGYDVRCCAILFDDPYASFHL